uniref:Uncharacterized protein n=1 Tax=Arundo donax TaxID=35708 RepID=A0A0A9DCH5_ARUDO
MAVYSPYCLLLPGVDCYHGCICSSVHHSFILPINNLGVIVAWIRRP